MLILLIFLSSERLVFSMDISAADQRVDEE